MAKKRQELDFIDIVMGANAEVIKQAYEARMKIDEQLVLREEAYRKIAELEEKVEEIIGEPGEFIFPAPPLQVAGYSKLIPASRPVSKPKPVTTPAPKKDDTNKDAEESKKGNSENVTKKEPAKEAPKKEESGK